MIGSRVIKILIHVCLVQKSGYFIEKKGRCIINTDLVNVLLPYFYLSEICGM
jgi:hypothetical protein